MTGRLAAYNATVKESFRYNLPLDGQEGMPRNGNVRYRNKLWWCSSRRRWVPLANLIRYLGIAEATFYRWKQLYGGLKSEQVSQFKQPQDVNAKLKRMVRTCRWTESCSRMPRRPSLRPSCKRIVVAYLYTRNWFVSDGPVATSAVCGLPPYPDGLKKPIVQSL